MREGRAAAHESGPSRRPFYIVLNDANADGAPVVFAAKPGAYHRLDWSSCIDVQGVYCPRTVSIFTPVSEHELLLSSHAFYVVHRFLMRSHASCVCVVGENQGRDENVAVGKKVSCPPGARARGGTSYMSSPIEWYSIVHCFQFPVLLTASSHLLSW